MKNVAGNNDEEYLDELLNSFMNSNTEGHESEAAVKNEEMNSDTVKTDDELVLTDGAYDNTSQDTNEDVSFYADLEANDIEDIHIAEDNSYVNSDDIYTDVLDTDNSDTADLDSGDMDISDINIDDSSSEDTMDIPVLEEGVTDDIFGYDNEAEPNGQDNIESSDVGDEDDEAIDDIQDIFALEDNPEENPDFNMEENENPV